MKFSLGMVLTVCLTGLQLAAVLTIVLSSYLTSERVLLDHARTLISEVAINTVQHAEGFLQPAKDASELITRLTEGETIPSDNTAVVESLLFQQLQIASQFSGIFYGDEQGQFVYVMKSEEVAPFRTKIISRDGEDRSTNLIWRDADFAVVDQGVDPTDEYDPRTRPWYQGAQSTMDLVWTDPYIFFTSQQPGITVATPILNSEGAVTGVIGVDIEISAISSFLADLKIGDSGIALVLNHNGDVIAHPDQALLKAENGDGTYHFVRIDQIEDPIARSAFGNFLQEDKISIDQQIERDFRFENENFVSTLTPMRNDRLPWTVAIYAPENDFIAAIKQDRTQSIAIAFAIAALTALVGFLLAKQINKPIRLLADRATAISKGEFVPDTPFPRTFTELTNANDVLTAEAARRTSFELRYGKTFELSSRGMAEVDAETGTFIRVNRRLTEILGYDADDLLEMSLMDICHFDDRSDFLALAKGDGADAEYRKEQRCVKKDGTLIWVMLNAVLVHDEIGNPMHNVITLDDVSAARLAQSQIEKLSSELSQQERISTIGQLAASLAHEINQPLAAIAQNIDAALLTTTDVPLEANELTEILRDVDDQTHRAAKVIRALRRVVQKEETTNELFELSKLIEQIVTLVQPEADAHDVHIKIQSTDVPDVVGKRVQIAQVLVNLLRHAIQSVATTRDCKERVICVWAKVGGDGEVILCVQDTGNGVKQKPELMAGFNASDLDGDRLGLSISSAIIESHGGRLWKEGRETDRRVCCSFKVGK